MTIEEFESEEYDHETVKEKVNSSLTFVTKYNEMLDKYNDKIGQIKKESFPKSSDFQDIIERSKIELLKMKDQFDNFIKNKSNQIIDKINNKMDVDKRIFDADKKISYLENEIIEKNDKLIDLKKIHSEIRESFFEVKEENDDIDEHFSSEEEKNSHNTKEDT